MKNALSPRIDLPNDVDTLFRRAGWQPGVNRRTGYRDGSLLGRMSQTVNDWWRRRELARLYRRYPLYHPNEFPEVSRIRDELFGLVVRGDEQQGPLVSQTLVFDQLPHCCSDNVSLLERIVGMRLCPVCEVLSTSTLLLAENGYVFQLGDIAKGVFFEGTTFGSAMSRVLYGYPGWLLRFDSKLDPTGELDYGPQWDGNTPFPEIRISQAGFTAFHHALYDCERAE